METTFSMIANSEVKPLVFTLKTASDVLRFLHEIQSDEARQHAYFAAKMALQACRMALAEVVERMDLIEVKNLRSN